MLNINEKEIERDEEIKLGVIEKLRKNFQVEMEQMQRERQEILLDIINSKRNE